MLAGEVQWRDGNGASSEVEPATERRQAKLQTEAQREWRFDCPCVTSASALTRRTGGRGEGGGVSRSERWSRRGSIAHQASGFTQNRYSYSAVKVDNTVGSGTARPSARRKRAGLNWLLTEVESVTSATATKSSGPP